MHAWEAIQKTINHVEERIPSDITIMGPIQETGTIIRIGGHEHEQVQGSHERTG